MSLTGIVLYIEPAGRVAYWITWQFGGLTKTDWGNIHILSSLLFIVAGAVHTWLNWKPLMNYFKDKMNRGVKLRRELIISSVVSVWVIFAAIWPFPPLSYLLDFNEWVKEQWVAEDNYEPPFGHAELLSLKTFSKKMDIDLTKATSELKTNGINFESAEETLEDISLANNISPMNLYLLIKKFEPAPEPEALSSYTPESIEVKFSGTGFGNKSVASVCENIGLDQELAKERLLSAGISPDLTLTMKKLAESANTEAIEIMKLLLLDSYQPKLND